MLGFMIIMGLCILKIFKEQKGQGILIDIMMALFIFIVILGYLTTVWTMNLSTIESNYLSDDMQRLAFQTTDLLVRTSGTPNNWETMVIDDVNTIGLATSDRILDEQKLNRFKNLGADYRKAKEIMQIGNYDFYFELQGVDDVNAGLMPMTEAQKVVVRRIVNYKGEEAFVIFTLYKVRP